MDSELLQRFMRRLDHIEFSVGRSLQDEGERMRHELTQLQSTVGNIQRARRAMQQESGLPLPPVGSHRGPGALPVQADSSQAVTPGPSKPPPEPLASAPPPLSIMEANMLEREVSHIRSTMSSPGPRGAFTNALVK